VNLSPASDDIIALLRRDRELCSIWVSFSETTESSWNVAILIHRGSVKVILNTGKLPHWERHVEGRERPETFIESMISFPHSIRSSKTQKV
jgi:hypothetical protein